MGKTHRKEKTEGRMKKLKAKHKRKRNRSQTKAQLNKIIGLNRRPNMKQLTAAMYAGADELNQ